MARFFAFPLLAVLAACKVAEDPQAAAQEAREEAGRDARFVAVSGYRKGRKQIDFLQTKSRIAITFAPLGETGFFTPVDASVGTQIGPVRITAQRIEAR